MELGLTGHYLTAVDNKCGFLFWISVIACVVLSYLLGSLNFAVIISKYFYKDDVRTHGSGNGGATNMTRTYGMLAGVGTFAGDAMKAVVSVMIGRVLLGILGAYLAGFFCIVGHLFPVYYKFRGGKGIATAITMILMTNWKVGLILLLIFALLVWATKYISVGSIIGVMVYPVVLNKFNDAMEQTPILHTTVTLISFLIMALILFMHRENFKRLMDGTEPKLRIGHGKKTESRSTDTTGNNDDMPDDDGGKE